MGAPWRLLWAFALADLGNFLVRYPAMVEGAMPVWGGLGYLFVALRWTFLAACLWAILQPALQAEASRRAEAEGTAAPTAEPPPAA
jgi:hypothetical protein